MLEEVSKGFVPQHACMLLTLYFVTKSSTTFWKDVLLFPYHPQTVTQSCAIRLCTKTLKIRISYFLSINLSVDS